MPRRQKMHLEMPQFSGKNFYQLSTVSVKQQKMVKLSCKWRWPKSKRQSWANADNCVTSAPLNIPQCAFSDHSCRQKEKFPVPSRNRKKTVPLREELSLGCVEKMWRRFPFAVVAAMSLAPKVAIPPLIVKLAHSCFNARAGMTVQHQTSAFSSDAQVKTWKHIGAFQCRTENKLRSKWKQEVAWWLSLILGAQVTLLCQGFCCIYENQFQCWESNISVV